MISCPECRTSYELSSRAIENSGQALQCARCHHVWKPDANAEKSSKKEVRRIVLRPARTTSDARATNDEGDGNDVAPTLMEKAQALAKKPDDAHAPEIHATMQSGQERDERENDSIPGSEATGADALNRANWVNIAAMIAVVLIVGGGLFMADRVVSVVPGLSSLYKLAGIDINLRGLEFSEVKTETRQENGSKTLIVEGVIKNITNNTVAVPAVRLMMRAADKQDLYSWFHEPEQKQLAAGQILRFKTILNDPPGNALDIQLKFTKRRLQQASLN